MALKKQKTMADGSVGEYWKITDVNPSKLLNKLVVKLHLFKNKQSADDGLKPMQCIYSFDFALPENYKTLTVDQLTAIAYENIKAKVSGQPNKFNQMMFNDLYGAEDA